MLYLLLLLTQTRSYNPSLYAPKPDDYIIALETDSFYYLGDVETPPKAKHIKEAHFSTQTISDEDYAWPGHLRVVDQSIEDEEGLNMNTYRLV